MLNSFRNAICSDNDIKRVIGVQYPEDEELSVPELADFVSTQYLSLLRNDSRGYVVVSQSFSGHVGMNLAHHHTPGQMIGQVFVNAFASPPGPSWIHNGRLQVPANFFERQPPPWMVSRMFLGAGGSGMHIVQAAGAKVEPRVMRQRLDICLAHDSWSTWRCPDLLPGESTLYLRGEADAIVANEAAERMREARPDILWERVPDGPHLLLQRFGRPAARAVHTFCERLSNQ
ncbi:unnamed protein product [Chondrus crispus]|uniref:AB hydrolase-1 domain-containing protein n=1 Tax=Chondrus crispus TaxID=2769 RepID=R7QA49_CHOCR|nr:unnamed protein product [Chondrus crispus]CDF34648.1 unnamed protein product [Chondrus crispus]|eukprot:XP_005714467.1 unnamed protein product [Chondrus crispus]